MVDDATPPRRSSGEIPMLLKGIVCGFFSLMAWLFASLDDVDSGARIGLQVVSAVSGLFTVGWLVAWVNSLATQFVGSDGDAMKLDSHSAGDAEHASEAPLEASEGMEFRLGDVVPEDSSVATRREPSPPGDDSWLELVLGMVFDILSVFPAFFVVVSITTLIVASVTYEIGCWIGLAPARESNMASVLVILMLLLSLGFGWRWRSRLTENDATRLQNTILLMFSAELAALGICIGLAVVGTLVVTLGEVTGFW
jgi:hypothetical protein